MKQYEKKAKELAAQMTVEEKAGLCSGSDFWHTKGVERLGLSRIMVTDGPHGLRKQEGSSDHLGINRSVPATCFPTAAATACSFDPALLREIGEALGEECLQEDVAVILGPGVNIKRSPLCGRNFEYFSEDPCLTGQMAAALIEGIQSKGIGTSLKHYAVNNQETRRMVIDAVVDQRALREIYLAGFETAVKQARPWTVMCSYNQVNGEFASQNKTLLTDILRTEWGFKGSVMTDWGATVDRVQGLAAGLDLDMPYTGPASDEAIIAAVAEGRLRESVLDTAAVRIISLLLAAKDSRKPGYTYDGDAHHELARKAAAQSAVLLKNDGAVLPLDKTKKIAVLGVFGKTPRYQGTGSSRINPRQVDNLCGILEARGIPFTYAPGYISEDDRPDPGLIEAAVSAAREAEAAVVCIGLPESYESEGFDRDHLRLPESHIALLEAVSRVNPNTVVLLSGGSAVEMPWLAHAKALLMLYLAGEAGAAASADLLFGDANPCGKLAETFPRKLEDNPSFRNFPGGEKTVEYRESIYVGYRYYDAAEADVLFPFGYGLSYTAFEYGDLTVSQAGGSVTASVRVKNTGTRAGAEAVQFYVSPKNTKVFRPVRELRAFGKVYLQAGEEKNLSVTLGPRAFAYYNPQKGEWITEAGEYILAAAASSRDIRCTAPVSIDGAVPPDIPVPDEYSHPGFPLEISREAF
ncbi:glycoside hydrolase family 3 C-terminal domain-containing protein [Breznakiella homolactica]|uniref:Glycoside hydrolase family 3 C-terminal domain-containing protein n=1 Tax=Breznakiella homolactica TaxID=2798577 RepID=A0A7T7XMA1_9SPIR|nr:glycoside hydrolase family 3 C-terminal domain-containing protein [Breznakiella homolactica]QQO08873.1 glycoside hydrolase family 3 C-terminal domain-containing protein [Breznakiella homolactica]